MIQLDVVLYRFVCDVSTFTGLFSEDAEGRRIPDVASFRCTWSRTPRANPTSSGALASHRVDGATEYTYFKALGADMALTFSPKPQQLILDGERDVITFAFRPSQYSAAGPLPVIAKGSLDPTPYFDKPMKNYAIKLRDAAGEVTGKLLFSLRVHEIDEEERATLRSNTVTSTAMRSPRSNSPSRGQMVLQRNPSRDRLLKTSPRSERLLRQVAEGVTREEAPPQQTRNATAQRSPPLRQASPHSQRDYAVVESVDIELERVAIKTESIDLDHPAPLLLGGRYSMKVRYGSSTFSTTRIACCNPKEVNLEGQQLRIPLKLADSAEKLRFSVWEDKRQVAGFSLDPAKFKPHAGEWKEYAIPFRYHPTGQQAALDVRVRRKESDNPHPLSNRPLSCRPSAGLISSGAAAGVDSTTALQTVPREETHGVDPFNRYAVRGTHAQTPLRFSTPPKQYVGIDRASQEVPLPHTHASASSRRGGSSPPRFITVTSGIRATLDASRTNTPLSNFDHFAENSSQRVSDQRSTHVRATSGTRGGWERTPMRQRPPPLTSNLADLPADLRPPDEHELYIAEVLARLERQQQAPRPQTSLVEEWIGWRHERERSRCNSVSSIHQRSYSVSSAVSRADSLASAVSRRALAPRPTKSNANNSVMTPFTPDTSAVRRRRSLSSAVECSPII
ncbi:hypothetical protein LSCM1_00634 [Leishmania martiniquensis]|uniref:Uncharacterized protein n=1 Tax=Leishmania martiniquensis TaxID=1580590 RepID=A0A836GC84_9TRYP|nr:hypothetical protein LSCM1_00634 [Leishmania martiniquensis]